MTTKPIMLDETGAAIKQALSDQNDILMQIAGISPELVFDGTEYTNIAAYLRGLGGTNKIYTVKTPKFSDSQTSACVKADANAGLVVEPSTISTAGRDELRARDRFHVMGRERLCGR